jgi:hypothetical protein
VSAFACFVADSARTAKPRPKLGRWTPSNETSCVISLAIWRFKNRGDDPALAPTPRPRPRRERYGPTGVEQGWSKLLPIDHAVGTGM